MQTKVYAIISNQLDTAVYHNMNSIKGVIKESPSLERIIFEKGEIELKISGDLLSILSKTYLEDGSSKVTYRTVKKLADSNNFENALRKAKMAILQRATALEMGVRERNIKQNMERYFKNEAEARRKRSELTLLKTEIDSETFRKIAEAYTLNFPQMLAEPKHQYKESRKIAI